MFLGERLSLFTSSIGSIPGTSGPLVSRSLLERASITNILTSLTRLLKPTCRRLSESLTLLRSLQYRQTRSICFLVTRTSHFSSAYISSRGSRMETISFARISLSTDMATRSSSIRPLLLDDQVG